MLRFTTAGESHGQALVSILEGMPAGVPLTESDIDADLARRQQGYGRGRRMQIERDHAEILSGVRASETLGSPIALLIQNRGAMRTMAVDAELPESQSTTENDAQRPLRVRAVTRPRPGHADLAGMLKYDRRDGRDILERASARETTARVASGAICRKLLSQFGITIGSHVVELGGIVAEEIPLPVDINAVADESQLRTLDRKAEERMIALIDEVKREGDTLGGVCEVVCRGVPIGLGSHVSWDRKLDTRISAAIMSIPAVKGVGIGIGFEAARRRGSAVHDEILGSGGTRMTAGMSRGSNRAGGLEGGMTNGEPIVVRVAMKPISTLMRPLATVDMETGEPAKASVERSDVTAVPAMGVIAEAMLAFVVADAVMEKFGGDSLRELRRNFEGYIDQIASRRI
jgi:chorismate synthase